MTSQVDRRESEPTHELAQQLEAILMVIDEPVDTDALAQVLEQDHSVIETQLRALQLDYEGKANGPRRGFVLRETGAGWRIYTAPELAPLVSQFVTAGRTARLSQAALETLAVIAYRQPVARAEIAAIRSVNVDSVVRTLLARELITEAPSDGENGPTRYQTTRYFMEKMGISSLSELPSLAPALPSIETADELDALASSATSRVVPTTTE